MMFLGKCGCQRHLQRTHDARNLCGSMLQAAAFAAEHMHPDARLVIGGDFNSLWRKYTSDEYDKVSHDHLYTGCPILRPSERMPL